MGAITFSKQKVQLLYEGGHYTFVEYQSSDIYMVLMFSDVTGNLYQS